MKKKNDRSCILLSVFLSALLMILPLAGCSRQPEKQSHTWFEYFDTVCTVIAYDDPAAFADACGLIDEKLAFYDALFDIYDDADFANAKTLNDCAGQGAVPCDPELLSVLSAGKELFGLTGGECNIAFGAVLSLWHDVRETALGGGQAVLPELSELSAAAEHCRTEDLQIKPSDGTAELLDPRMSVDLGAIAKGFAADRIMEALTAAGHTGYIISLGGNVKANGEKLPGEPWVTGIANPDDESGESYLERVAITDQSLVTSGSYQRYFELDGVRYHHIISPETLFPKNDYLSVTVLAESSTMADALSTALFNMDFADGTALIGSLDGVEAAWVFPDMNIKFSDGFSSCLLD